MSRTADLVLVAGRPATVRYRRRWNGVWGSTTVVGSSAFTDSVNDDVDLGLAVRGTKQVVCGAIANQEYKLYWADSNGAFAQITADDVAVENKVYRVDAYDTSPVWNNITPSNGNADHHQGLAVDV
jgi:hypothetical protein